MYEIFYNLRAEPFRLSPDHRFCYEHKGYAKARAYMAYAFMRAEGFVMVTGRPGTGKTTLIGDLIESLAKDNVTTANLVCTQLQADDLLKTVAYSFGVGSEGTDKAELLQRLNVLFHNWHRDGRRALLIVDEAQDLSITAIEELRLLTNIQVDGQPLLQIFLLGQPELRDLILSPQMEQVHQRIVAASHLEALELEETEAYVRYRLEAVGWCGDPALSRAIFPLIYKFSEGVPRRINLICSRLFLHGGVEQRHQIGVQDVRVVISELQAENLAAGSRFSDADFAAEDEFEQVGRVSAAEPEAVQAPAGVQLRAVSNDPVTAPGGEPAAGAPGQKKKDTPVVVAIPKAVTVSAPVADAIPIDPSDSGGHKDAPVMPEPVAQAPAQERPGGAEGGSRRRVQGKPGKRKIRGKGIGTAVIWAVLIVSLFTFLGVFAARPGAWNDWQSKLQGLWEGAISMQPAPVASDTGLPLPYKPDVDPELERVNPGYELPGGALIVEPVIASIVEPIAPDTGEVRQVPDTRIVDGSEVDLPREEALPVSDDSEPLTELPGQEGERLAPEETASPEKDQVLFVAFAFDSVDLPPASRETLDHVVKTMSQLRSSVASITGFSDNQGEETYNLELSRQRANAVEQYLVGEGVERERLRVEGRGALYDFTDAEISAAGLESEEYRIVKIRISSGPGSTDI